MSEQMSGLNAEQQWHLEKEGLEARMRNQLSPFLSLISFLRLYQDAQESSRDQVFELIQKTVETAKDSFEHLKALSVEANNQDLVFEVDKLRMFLEEINSFTNESAESLIAKKDSYNATIDRIIELSKVG